jgi:AraC-like DNA-binding protein
MEMIFIRNMVCDRCIRAVKEEFTRHGIEPLDVQLGEVVIHAPLSALQKSALGAGLRSLGFELLDDRNSQLVSRIKAEIVRVISGGTVPMTRWSVHLARHLGKDYSTLSSLFSSTEGLTIEQYFILQRTEKVKELLAYGDLSVKEIAYGLGFSSVAHLSNQFKKVTGLTPRHFKEVGRSRRESLDRLGSKAPGPSNKL